MGRTIGIDLGTTFSAVAVVNDLDQPEILYNRDGEPITPSVVLFQGDSPLVGSMAKRAATTAPLDVVEYVKRSIGDPSWRFDTTEGRSLRAEEVSAIILKRLKEDAEAALGEPINDAVITVPAYFDDARRRATQDAGTIAGLNVVRVLNEPTAAALAYGYATSFRGTLLVYDLGGGTFDVTILRIADGDFDILATGGDRNLGGFDWDNKLMMLIEKKFVAAGGEEMLDGGDREALLRERAIMAKHSLTQVDKARIVVSTNGLIKTIEITRVEFEDITSSLLSKTVELTTMVRDDAALTWDGIDKILLVGGSTRMPMVRRMVETVISRPVERRINPDEVVALGAAVQGRLEQAKRGQAQALSIDGHAVQIGDVTSHGLGTLALNPETGVLENTVLIPHNAKIPGHGTGRFFTIRDNQTAVDVEVTVGDDEDPAYVRIVNANHPVRVAIPPYPASAPIEIKYAYDIDQTVFIEVIDLTSDRSLGTFEVPNVANMSRADVTEAAQRMNTTEVG